jgi:hypothetical protein
MFYMKFELIMPDLSTTGSPMKVLCWLVAVGELVEPGQAVLEVETDNPRWRLKRSTPGRSWRSWSHPERKPAPVMY